MTPRKSGPNDQQLAKGPLAKLIQQQVAKYPLAKLIQQNQPAPLTPPLPVPKQQPSFAAPLAKMIAQAESQQPTLTRLRFQGEGDPEKTIGLGPEGESSAVPDQPRQPLPRGYAVRGIDANRGGRDVYEAVKQPKQVTHPFAEFAKDMQQQGEEARKTAAELKRAADAQEDYRKAVGQGLDADKQRLDSFRKSIEEQRDLERQRIDSFAKTTRSMRDQIETGNKAADGIRTFGSVLSDLVRGNFSSAIQGVASFVQRRAAGTLAQRDQASQEDVTESRERERRSRTLARDTGKDVAGRQRAFNKGDLDNAVGQPVGLPIPGMPKQTQPLPIPGMPKQSAPVTAPVLPPSRPPTASVVPATAGAGEAAGAAAGLSELGGLAASAAAVAGPVAAAAAALSMMAKAAVDLGGKASPVSLMRFQFAMEDAQAVMGRVFIPVLDLMTDAVRLLGDVLASILPDTKDVSDALAPFREALQDIRDGLAPVAPAIKEFLTVMLQIQGVIWKVTTAMNPFLIIMKAIGAIGSLLGGEDKLKSSVGAAVRPASFVDVNSYLKQSYAAAASLGRPGEKQEQSGIEKLIEVAREIRNKIPDPLGKIEKAGNYAAKKYDEVETWIAEAIARGLTGQ